MAKEWTTVHFKGMISSDRVKAFLVDLAKTGVCERVRVDVIDDDYWGLAENKKPNTIFDGNPKNGLEVSVWFYCKRRENESNIRMGDNPVVNKFVETYGLYKES